MKIILLLAIYLASAGFGYSEEVTYPINIGKVERGKSKTGEFVHKGWKYVYEIRSKGTRSERRIGRLFLNGKEVKGKIGDLHQTPIGSFIYFGEDGYNKGWLNTMTYDHAVFTKDGTPNPKVVQLLKAIRAKNKTAEQRHATESLGAQQSKNLMKTLTLTPFGNVRSR